MIQRDDLVAAAAVGLLQYRQIDPLLIFLLQRDVRAQRAALLARSRSALTSGVQQLLSCLVGVLAIAAAMLFATHALEPLGVGALIVFMSLYATGTLGLVSWLKRRGLAVPIRILATLAIALAPLAVFALQQVIR